MTDFDYIIIGGGTSGCVLANRLSVNPDNQVLLIEAGAKDDYFWIDIPVGYLFTINNPITDWCYKTQPDAGLNGRAISYARGKVLGGCSSINAMIYMRGQASDYDHWEKLGNRGWGWKDVLPVFRRSENYQHGESEYHGINGEMHVEERRVNWEILDAWREAAEEIGIPKIDEFNRGDNFGNAYFQMNQHRGRRWSATKAFLKPAINRKNLKVMTRTQVTRIIISNNRAIGVELVSNHNSRKILRGRREIIIAAGTVGSPQLLELSGIGETDLLKNAGVQPVHHLPGVGENLQDHLQIRSIYKVKNTRTLNRQANSLLGLASMAIEYALLRRGPLTMPPSQLGAFAKSDKHQSSANIEWHVQPLSLDKFGDPLHKFDAITPAVCNLRPSSRGHIHIVSSQVKRHPAITLNYLSTDSDRAVAIAGMKYTRKIMNADALKKFKPEEIEPGINCIEDTELAHAAGDLGTTIFHPVGTCKMGNDKMAVVDDRLRVHGIDHLRVVDASIMPTITSGNTNAPTVMIAEKGAEFILEDAVS
ncbi:MAG: choline dehydrogenase [Gammaproteobacteria bacterium TMED1]|nr:MAG: choline dehydrogenase [Gammaproteobacteria bacterium TMED1]|tara:strand:- start:6107 stop:7708 length:1602 start_codon:yes stop_codon:yes gene_type:complete